MKIKLPEHDHKLTNILKVLLFSLLMLLPFLDIGTRCGYVLLNKNAYQSYYGETINEYNDTQVNYDNLQANTEYLYLNVSNDVRTNDYGTLNYINVSNVKSLNGFNGNTDLTNTTRIRFYLTTSSQNFVFQDINGNSLLDISLLTNNVQFSFQYEGYYNNNSSAFQVINYFYTRQYNSYSYLDNVFDYSIDKMANSPLYNWTTQTGMYTGVNAMTTGLGITTPLFAILITYWIFLTIIYIILDIVLSLFTFMTHIFTKKE